LAVRKASGVSWLIDPHDRRKSHPDLIGPGRLVLVVGPSGAGKDTLISGARLACTEDETVVFPRRVVTRPSSTAEDHDSIDLEDFNRATANGAFALWWDAHGHRYGIPRSVNDDIRAGRTVVCNVSRSIVNLARARYAIASVVLITAPQHVLEARLASRERPSDGDLERRIARSVDSGLSCEADFVIQNVAPPSVGIRRLISVIRDPGILVID
jgi:ribose 1,5-bisphosphokinase